MCIADCFALGPKVDDLRAELFLTTFTEVKDLRSVRVTCVTEIFKENIDLELLGQDFTFVFSDIFRGQLHFASTYVIAILNEGSIKHDPAYH